MRHFNFLFLIALIASFTLTSCNTTTTSEDKDEIILGGKGELINALSEEEESEKTGDASTDTTKSAITK